MCDDCNARHSTKRAQQSGSILEMPTRELAHDERVHGDLLIFEQSDQDRVTTSQVVYPYRRIDEH